MHVTSNPIRWRAEPTLWNGESPIRITASQRDVSKQSPHSLSADFWQGWFFWRNSSRLDGWFSFASQCRGEPQVLQEERISPSFRWKRCWVAHKSQAHLLGWRLTFWTKFRGLKMLNINSSSCKTDYFWGRLQPFAHFTSAVKYCSCQKEVLKKNDDYIQKVQ